MRAMCANCMRSICVTEPTGKAIGPYTFQYERSGKMRK